MVKSILLVGLGGGLGSIFRYLTAVFSEKYLQILFPLGTFFVNIIGCFLIGLLMGFLGQNVTENQNVKLLFISGFCGGYTTFSTFAYENIAMLQNNNYRGALFYIALSVVSGVFAVWLGIKVAQ